MDNVLSRKGATFFLLFIFTSFLVIMAIQSRIAASDPGPHALVLPEPFTEASDLALGIPYEAAVVMTFLGLFIGCYLGLVAIRVFVHGYDGIPREAYAEDVVVPTLYFFLGTLIFAPLFLIGLAAFVLPGAFVAISLGFYAIYTTIHGDDFVDAFTNSWNLSSGHRLPLYLLFGAFLLAAIVVTALGLVVYVLVWNLSTVLAEVMLAVGASGIVVFTLALVAGAYTSIRTHYVRRRELSELPGGEEEAASIGDRPDEPEQGSQEAAG